MAENGNNYGYIHKFVFYNSFLLLFSICFLSLIKSVFYLAYLFNNSFVRIVQKGHLSPSQDI